MGLIKETKNANKTTKTTQKPSKLQTIIVLIVLSLLGLFFVCYIPYNMWYGRHRLKTPVDPIFKISESGQTIRGTSEMVDYIYQEVKDYLDNSNSTVRENGVWYIIQHSNDFFENDEVMENLMCYGWLLEYSSPNEEAAKMGERVAKVVKYMYRNLESLDSDFTQFNLKKIDKHIETILSRYYISEDRPKNIHLNDLYSDSSFSISESPSLDIEPIIYETEFSCGNYISGIDFPAGDYDIVAKTGRGNVSSDNMFSGGINALMGEKGSGDSYHQKYSNISLPKGTTLRIGGELVVKIHSDEASGEELSKRDQSITEAVTLSNGHFTSGKHFEPGTYDITCTSGSGNISSDNMFDGGLNEVMGYQKEGYIQKAYHIELPKDTVLTVDGIEIKMTPSK